jgi:hypothetical protein
MSYLILLPDLEDDALRAKLVKGMGHNLYGEPAWPNELLYVFPICIIETMLSCCTCTFLFPLPLDGEAAATKKESIKVLMPLVVAYAKDGKGLINRPHHARQISCARQVSQGLRRNKGNDRVRQPEGEGAKVRRGSHS